MRVILFLAAITAFAADSPNWVTAAGGTAKLDPQGRIVELDLRSSWISDSDLPAIAALPALESLDLSLTRITDRGLKPLKKALRLKRLNLRFAELFTDEGMSMVRNLKQLRQIDLRGTKVTDTTLEYLAELPLLESVDVGFAQITDNGIDSLGALPNLQRLTLGGNKLTDVGLQALRQLRSLQYLDLGGAQRTDSGMWSISMTDSGINAIATLENLQELRLRGIAIASRHLEALKALPKLERLSIQDCKRVGPEAISFLEGYSSLRLLDVAGSGLVPGNLDSLKTRLPKVTVVN